MSALRIVLGDQLSFDMAALADLDAARDTFLMMEVTEETTYVRHHKQKIVLVLSAMRHFTDALRRRGVTVDYVELEGAARPIEPGQSSGRVKRVPFPIVRRADGIIRRREATLRPSKLGRSLLDLSLPAVARKGAGIGDSSTRMACSITSNVRHVGLIERLAAELEQRFGRRATWRPSDRTPKSVVAIGSSRQDKAAIDVCTPIGSRSSPVPPPKSATGRRASTRLNAVVSTNDRRRAPCGPTIEQRSRSRCSSSHPRRCFGDSGLDETNALYEASRRCLSCGNPLRMPTF